MEVVEAGVMIFQDGLRLFGIIPVQPPGFVVICLRVKGYLESLTISPRIFLAEHLPRFAARQVKGFAVGLGVGVSVAVGVFVSVSVGRMPVEVGVVVLV